MTDLWQLVLGEQVIATLKEESFDFPWVYAKLFESPMFEQYRVYFSDEDEWSNTQEFDELCERISTNGGFTLHNLSSGDFYKSFRLNHDGETVWFRYS